MRAGFIPRTRRVLLTICCIGLFACDQFAAVGIAELESDVPLAPSLDAGSVSRRDPDDFAAAPAVDTPDASMDSRDPSMASVPDDAGMAADAATAACPSPDIALCDPVLNIGCSAALDMQCAVDLLATELAGYCTFFAPGVAPLECLNTGVTESCAPGSACIAGACAKLCFCDSQCELGQCCSIPVGEQGFMACGDC